MSDIFSAGISSSRDRDLALALAVAARTSAYYGADNIVLQQACAFLGSLLAERMQEAGSVTIGVHNHCVFIDKIRLRTTASTYGRFAYLVHLFEAWGLGSMAFFQGLTEDELLATVLVLGQGYVSGTTDLAVKLQEQGIENVRTELGAPSPASTAAKVYAAGMQVSRELQETMEEGGPANVRRLRRVTQAVIDDIMLDEQSLLALTTIKHFDRYLISHSTNVAILSVLLGQRLGLSKARLGELCLAGFLHDVGKVEVAPEILRKEGPLDPAEWEEMRRHPVFASRILLGTSRLTPSTMRAVVVAFEHHLNYDMSGYPKTEVKESVTLFGNIVSIADRYDAMTTARAYRRKNLTPYEALHHLVNHAGTYFDPILVKLFVDILGLYPPGTLLELISGDVGVVCEPPTVGQPLDRPKIRILVGDWTGKVVDLNERLEGEYAHEVRWVLNPHNMGQVPAVDMSVLDAAG